MERGRETGPVFTMKIRYLGTPGESHDSIHMYGIDLPLGEDIEVEDKFAIRKLSNHPHFEATGEKPVDAEVKTKPEEQEHGDTAGTGAPHAAEAGSDRGPGARQRGRPRKGT